VLRISSASGSIRVKVNDPASNSNRTFDTSIDTKSGSVKGEVLLGNGGSTTINTVSGSIRTTILTVGVDENSPLSTLTTGSNSGTQTISIQGPAIGGKVARLQANHHSLGSGSIILKYSPNWTGKMHAKIVGSGGVKATGDGLQFQQNGNKEVYAWRGSGDLATVEAIGQGSGKIDFAC